MKHWKVILGIALIFIAGFLSGWMGSHYVKIRPPFHKQRAEDHTQAIMKRLDDKLDLTDEQWAKMEVIVRRTQEKARKLSKEHKKKMHGLMERDMEEFKKILNPDQQNKLEELRREFKKRRRIRDKDQN
jgi:Spy/CpxP family protein refolding chaperone